MTVDTDRGLMDELRKNTFRWIDQHAADAASAFASYGHVMAHGLGGNGPIAEVTKQSTRNCAGRSGNVDGAIQRGRLSYSGTASAKIALPCCVCEYQSVKRKT
jgi:hypothetical protein